MKKTPVVVVVLLSLSALPSRAAQDYSMMGLGATSCGKFAELSRMWPERIESEYFDWAQGFMSGINMVRLIMTPPLPTKNINGTSIESQKRYLRNYCDQHPLGEVSKGVLELYESLPLSAFRQ